MKDLAGQVAVVTGAGTGIGKAIALGLGARGATLALVGRRPLPLADVAATAHRTGIVAFAYPTDLAAESDIRRLADTLGREFQAVDILVHSAAAVRLGPLQDAPPDDFEIQYRTNVFAPSLLTQVLLPGIRQRRGQIVFINSSVGLVAKANAGQYSATKHALKAIADSLRDEVNRDGVRVLSVFPGRTATPTQEKLHELEQRRYRPEQLLQSEDVAAVVVHSLCLPRTAEVTEIKIRPLVNFDSPLTIPDNA